MRTAPIAVALLALLALSPVAPAEDEDPLAPVRRLVNLRDHREAEAALLLRLAEDEKDVAALKLLADVYLRIERPADATLCLTKARALVPEDPEVHGGLFETALAADGWTPEARTALAERLTAFLAAGDEEWRLVAAYYGYTLLDDDAALAALRARILAKKPAKVPDVIDGDLFEAAATDPDPKKREPFCREYLALFPDGKQSNLVREVLLATLREDRARLVAEATAMLAADPGNRRIHASLGRWLVTLTPPDPAAAAAHLEQAVALLAAPREVDRPDLLGDEGWRALLLETRGRYLALLGRALFLGGDPVGAALALAEASGLVTHDVNLYAIHSEVLAALGLPEAAKDAAARSWLSGPSTVPLDGLRERAEALTGPAPRFSDATEAAGFAGVAGGRPAFGDVDGDGDPDLLLDGGRLFRNDGAGSFALDAGYRAPEGARGGLLADLDDDGDLDVLVFRTGHPVVLENDGLGTFADRTPEALRGTGDLYTEAAAVLDVDGDGLLDFYLANYERPPYPPLARGTPDLLFRNLGGFAFEDATARIEGVSAEPMCGRGAVPCDFDDDGDTDLYVANYRLDPDFLLVNRDGRLVNEARARGTEGQCDEGAFGHGIGPAAGDVDGDGHLDFVVGNLAHPRYIGFSDVTRIWRNGGPPDYRFTDAFPGSGVRFEETHSNPTLADFDLDGDLDLVLTSIYAGRSSFLYRNDGGGRFTDVTFVAGVRTDNGWGSAAADADGDGDPDLFVASGSGVRYYRNDGPTGRVLSLRLAGGEGVNGGAIGARVTVEGGGLRLVREVSGGTGTGCQDGPALLFGLGAAEGPFLVTVRWPDGTLQRIAGVAPGRYRLPMGGNLTEAK